MDSQTSSPVQNFSEAVLWEQRPSQLLNFYWFLSCVLILPLPIALAKYIVLRCQHYRLTDESFYVRRGVFTVKSDHLELYRVKDYRLEAPFLFRILGLARVVLSTSDISSPQVVIRGIDSQQQAEYLLRLIRERVEVLREQKGVREVDGLS